MSSPPNTMAGHLSFDDLSFLVDSRLRGAFSNPPPDHFHRMEHQYPPPFLFEFSLFSVAGRDRILRPHLIGKAFSQGSVQAQFPFAVDNNSSLRL